MGDWSEHCRAQDESERLEREREREGDNGWIKGGASGPCEQNRSEDAEILMLSAVRMMLLRTHSRSGEGLKVSAGLHHSLSYDVSFFNIYVYSMAF